MAKYCSKYYTLKANIKEQSIIIKNVFKIQIFNNFSFAFKTYFTIVNNRMQKNEKLEEDKVLFKAIEEIKTCIKAKHKTSTKFCLDKIKCQTLKKSCHKKE